MPTIRAEDRAIARCSELIFRRAFSVRRRLGNSTQSQRSSKASNPRKTIKTVSTVISRMVVCSHCAFLNEVIPGPPRGAEISMDTANSITLAVDKKSANQSSRVKERNFPGRETNRSGFKRRIVHTAKV